MERKRQIPWIFKKCYFSIRFSQSETAELTWGFTHGPNFLQPYLEPLAYVFVTTKTSMGRALLQSERKCDAVDDVLRSYVAADKFQLLDFVVMPDHVPFS